MPKTPNEHSITLSSRSSSSRSSSMRRYYCYIFFYFFKGFIVGILTCINLQHSSICKKAHIGILHLVHSITRRCTRLWWQTFKTMVSRGICWQHFIEIRLKLILRFSEESIKDLSDVMKVKLPSYEYINLDSGW